MVDLMSITFLQKFILQTLMLFVRDFIALTSLE